VTGRHIDAVDTGHLARALELAERGRPTAAPNPVVGSVIVRDGRVLGEGWHVRPGGDHAEVAALKAAGDAAGATAYVSLEPCCHHGRTPPCTDALIAAGVARVVVATLDPSAKVNGRGVERLRAARIDVDVAEGELEHAARLQNQPFRALHLLGRPLVTGKAAVSLDGATADAAGRSQWISSPESRALVHRWRQESAAVGVGIGTALADDPMLTARDVDPPAERQPLRVVFDRRARLPLTSALVTTAADVPVVDVCEPGAEGRAGLEAAGVDVVEATGLADALHQLGQRKVTSLLVEGGAGILGALVADGLLDRLELFVAPVLLGDGRRLIDGWSAGLGDAPRATALSAEQVGPDILLRAVFREV
jgi:diaminohydroxyphosphoribosylaminopyrimidine deaminase/5-amino-6-(5-phosphoribosylamino)uracil reductase